MSTRLRLFFLCLMTTALGAGFVQHLVPLTPYNFERLHIFLFNLCTGGTILLYYTEKQKELSLQAQLFCLGALLFTLCAFMRWYIPTIILSILLAAIVERVRTRHFGKGLPRGIFSQKDHISQRFHHAALLCLALSLLFSSPIILNDIYLQWFNIPKLNIDTFFLGFSFPLSLISLSVIFSLMETTPNKRTHCFKEFSFWSINLGVIIFFIFILAGVFWAQVVVACILFYAVVLVTYLYFSLGDGAGQKAFLLSGLLFLIMSTITGLLYIFLKLSPEYTPENSTVLLRLHTFTALYGWNICGLTVIVRNHTIPFLPHSKRIIGLHWFTVVVLCPMVFFIPQIAIIATLSYAYLVYTLFFIKDQTLIH